MTLPPRVGPLATVVLLLAAATVPAAAQKPALHGAESAAGVPGKHVLALRPQPIAIPPTYTFQDRNAALIKDFVFPVYGGADTVVVPAGFVTDYASIPPVLRWMVRGDHDVPAIVHDYLYWRQCDQRVADRLFEDGLRQMGLPAWKRRTMRYTLSLFGGHALKSNRRDRDAGLPRIIPEAYLPPPVGDWTEYREYLRRENVPLDVLQAAPPADCPSAKRTTGLGSGGAAPP